MTDEVSTAESLREIALDRGWRYRERDVALADRWCGAPFTTWQPAQARDVVTGRHRGVPIAVLRFVFGDFGTEGRSYLVVAATLPAPLARISLVPLDEPVDTNPYGWLYEPEDAVLAETYQVATADPAAPGVLLQLGAVDLLRAHRPVDWRVEETELLAIEPDTTGFDVDEVDATIDVAARIAAGMAPAVLEPPEPVPTPPAAADPGTPIDVTAFPAPEPFHL
ncbi:MAG TPA: hypothetical protein VGN37_20065 [Actinocatenispora sp.]